ncbi:MAG: cation diffusion facilitator family transporter [Gammaproteobacteria bacterium]|jgi:cation diffusion facilitator family transporter
MSVDVSHLDFRHAATRKVTLVGAATNFGLSLAQIAGGLFTHSQGLIADGLHTLSDLVSDAVVLYASRQASVAADEQHPYGHGRIETLGTVVLGSILVLVAIGIGYSAGERLLQPHRLLSPTPLALFFAALAIVSKEGLYRYTIHVARRVNSRMLRANAWHHRSDAISSLIVILGIGGTLLGIQSLDAVAALVVALFIARMGGQLIWQSVEELIDTALDDEMVASIREEIMAIEGVAGLHLLRTRRSGGQALVDVHVLVNPRISVSEGHHIGEQVEKALVTRFDEVTDVTVHVDPEDDETAKPSRDLPTRAAFVKHLREQWASIEAAKYIEDLTLHYHDGRIHLDICLPLTSQTGIDEAEQTGETLRAAAKQLPEVGSVKILYR